MLEILQIIWDWFLRNYGWVVSLFIQGFIAYHVFFLSKKLSNRAKLEHKDRIKQKTEDLLSKIRRDGLRSKVYLVNINRYFKDYPSNEERKFDGYSHIRAEIKATRFDGIEFTCGISQVYRKEDGSLTFNDKYKDSASETFKVLDVGIVPYEWIEYVDLEGDEYAYVPLFFTRFKGRIYWKRNWKRFLPSGYPYKRLAYYRESEVYHEGSDPVDMKWSLIYEPISRK